MTRRRGWLLVPALTLAACGMPGRPPAGAGSPGFTGHLTLLAAASLTDAFNQVAREFEDVHPGVTISASYGASSTLAAQLEQGAPGDVFASADTASMDRVVKAGLVAGSARVFARNSLEIVVAPGNPPGVHGLADLSRPGLTVVLCQPAVPCGKYGQQALARAGVSVTPASQEVDVRAVLSRVELGEADAGVVYASDVHAAGRRVQGVPIPAPDNVVADYPLAVMSSGHPALASAFVDFVLGPRGRAALAAEGFTLPGG